MSYSEKTQHIRVQKIRTAGPNGDYWYVVEESKNLKQNKTKEVVFWKTSIAIFRGADGKVRALENRCAHRHLRLSESMVEGNQLVCMYHGWRYDGAGKCVDICSDVSGKIKTTPDIKIRSYPVKEKYGFIWIFPGDPELSEKQSLPTIPQFERPNPWTFVPIVSTIKAHFSMVIENGCDFNHEYLHRDYNLFTDSKLINFSSEGKRVDIQYQVTFGKGKFKNMVHKRDRRAHQVNVWYDYPYQASNAEEKYLHWMFVLPIDEANTRIFFIFMHKYITVPYIWVNIPFAIRKPVLHVLNKILLRPLLAQDWEVLEEEQKAYENHFGKPILEYNPIIRPFQDVMLEQRDMYLKREFERLGTQDALRPDVSSRRGAGVSLEDFKKYSAGVKALGG